MQTTHDNAGKALFLTNSLRGRTSRDLLIFELLCTFRSRASTGADTSTYEKLSVRHRGKSVGLVLGQCTKLGKGKFRIRKAVKFSRRNSSQFAKHLKALLHYKALLRKLQSILFVLQTNSFASCEDFSRVEASEVRPATDISIYR